MYKTQRTERSSPIPYTLDPRPCSSQHGTTLVELLVYVGIFSIVVNLSMSAYLSVTRISTLGMSAMNRLETMDKLQEDFARTVRQAQSVVPAAAHYQTAPDQLVLELPPPVDRPDARRFAVWGLIGAKQKLARLEFLAKGEDYTPLDFYTYPLPLNGVRFDLATPAASTRLVAMELKVLNAAKRTNKPPVTYCFTATLRSKGIGTGGAK